MKPPRAKPKLNSREVEVLISLHCGKSVSSARGISGRALLLEKGLVCYAEGWALTKGGKQLARHLTGRT